MSDGPLDILLVTKPIAPPWTDGTLNLARCLFEASEPGYRFRIPVPKSAPSLENPSVLEEAFYPEKGHHGTTFKNNLFFFKFWPYHLNFF